MINSYVILHRGAGSAAGPLLPDPALLPTVVHRAAAPGGCVKVPSGGELHRDDGGVGHAEGVRDAGGVSGRPSV